MAGLRRKRSAQQDMRSLEEKQTMLASDIERGEAIVETARAAVAKAQRQEAAGYLGDIEPALAQAAIAEANEQLATAQVNLARLQIVRPELERRLTNQREAIRLEQLEAATVALREALDARTEVSAAFARALANAREQHPKLAAARDEVRARERAVRDLGGERIDADEAEWGDTRELVEFLTTSQPRRPVADEERAMRKRELDAANEERRERVHWLEQARALAYLTNTPEVMERQRERFFAEVPEHLRDEVTAVFRTTRAEVEANRDSIRLQQV